MKWLDALGVSESYQVPDAMMKALMDSTKRHEHISVYDLEPAMEASGYYLTIERKGKKTEIRRSAR